MFLVSNIDQMYKEMKKIQTGNRSLINPFQLSAYQKASIVEVGSKHGNGDEFQDFADLLFFWHKRFKKKNVRSIGNTHIIIFCLSYKMMKFSINPFSDIVRSNHDNSSVVKVSDPRLQGFLVQQEILNFYRLVMECDTDVRLALIIAFYKPQV
jgi:hypothetical protein